MAIPSMQPIPFRSLAPDYRQSLLDLVGTGGGTLRIDVADQPRIPTTFLASCRALAAHGAQIGLLNLAEPARIALTMIGGGGLPDDLSGLLPAPFLDDDGPFTVTMADDGGLRITARPGICSHGLLGTRETYAWLDGLRVTSLIIDLGVVEHVNSLLVSWLLQVSQRMAPQKPKLVKASRSVAVQMARLRLDHLVDIVPG